MSAGSQQLLDVLMLVGNIAPLAVYFLVLGLVNSHSRPYLTTSRADFLALTCVLTPVLLWPVPGLAAARLWWPLLLGLPVAGVVFFRLLPREGAGFVIYNISERACLRLLNDALRRLGWHGAWDGRTWRARDGTLSLHVRRFPLLRNMILSVDNPDACDPQSIHALGNALQDRLQSVSQLPSTLGACLVMIGAALLILPMWTMGRHIQDFVEVVSNFVR